MSWRTQPEPENQATQTLSNQAILALKQQYDDAELAFQDMQEKFDRVSQQLKTTEAALNRSQQQSAETARQFATLSAENEAQKQTIQSLVSQCKQYLTEIEQVKSVSQAEIHAKVQKEITAYQRKLLNMTVFKEYFPVLLSLIGLGAILYTLLGK